MRPRSLLLVRGWRVVGVDGFSWSYISPFYFYISHLPSKSPSICKPKSDIATPSHKLNSPAPWALQTSRKPRYHARHTLPRRARRTLPLAVPARRRRLPRALHRLQLDNLPRALPRHHHATLSHRATHTLLRLREPILARPGARRGRSGLGVRVRGGGGGRAVGCGADGCGCRCCAYAAEGVLRCGRETGM